MAINDKPEIESPKPVDAGPTNVLTTPAGPKMDLATVEPAHLFPLLNVRELDQPAAKRKLAEALKAGELAQLDLFCRDTPRACERLQAVMKARGLTLSVDALTQARLNQKLKTQLVFYTETLNADDIVKLFQQLAIEEHKAEAHFDKLVARPFDKAVAQLLGVEPKAKPKSAANDIPKTLTDSTADKLAARATPGNKSAEHPDLVVGLNLIRTTPSKELRQFLDHRKELRRDAVPVMIVIRTVE